MAIRSGGTIEEIGEPALEPILVRSVLTSVRNGQRRAVHLLESVEQHRAIDLFEKLRIDLDDIVRRDPQHVHVEGGVMDLAQRQTIRHCRQTGLVVIGDDVGGIE